MQAVRSTRRFLSGMLSLALVGALVACENPVEGDHEEHPVGLAILNSQGQVVASVTEGQAVTGQIAVARGATQAFTLVALAEDGDQLPLTGELGARIETQPANATLTLQRGQLGVTGTTAGSGTTKIVLTHGGHDELSGSFPVAVQ